MRWLVLLCVVLATTSYFVLRLPDPESAASVDTSPGAPPTAETRDIPHLMANEKSSAPLYSAFAQVMKKEEAHSDTANTPTALKDKLASTAPEHYADRLALIRSADAKEGGMLDYEVTLINEMARVGSEESPDSPSSAYDYVLELSQLYLDSADTARLKQDRPRLIIAINGMKDERLRADLFKKLPLTFLSSSTEDTERKPASGPTNDGN